MVHPSVDRLGVGAKVAFAYEHQYRVVEIIRGPWQSKAGDWLITAVDQDRILEDGHGIRSFRIDRIHNKISEVSE